MQPKTIDIHQDISHEMLEYMLDPNLFSIETTKNKQELIIKHHHKMIPIEERKAQIALLSELLTAISNKQLKNNKVLA